MRGTILTVSLAVLVGVSSVGCKSMPSLTWWKTASNSNSNATTAAHTAPALPSDVAIQTEGLAAKAATMTGGSAAPYVPTAASAVRPAGYPNTQYPNTQYPNTQYPNTQYPNTQYPNTGAPSYSSTVASSAVATPAINNSMNNSNLGTIDMPYNPNAVPPAATAAAAPAAAAPTANRYATTATPSYAATNTLPNSAAQHSDAGSRYTAQTGSGTKSAYNTTPAASLAPSYAPATAPTTPSPRTQSPTNNYATSVSTTGAVGDRYAQPASSTLAPATQTSTTGNFGTNSETSPVQTTPTVASSGPYRPGATSTYPGVAAEPTNYEMASRTEAPASATGTTPTTGTGSSVPNVATPGYTPAPSAPQVPRYW